jgi:hypothetical protein
MRCLFLCFLWCLMPLRLWAGASMPMAHSGSHLAAVATASPAQHTKTPAAHDCHGAMAEPMPETHTQLALHDVPVQAADCHDGHCQLCGVCHQGLSLMSWPLVMPVFQAHPLPVSATWAHGARMSAPLMKPPIS